MSKKDEKLFGEEEDADEDTELFGEVAKDMEDFEETGEWERDEAQDEDAEVVKLEPGKSIEGLLVDKFDSVRYGCGIYKIKVKNKDKLQIILGTTLLDKMLEKRQIGEEVKIERHEDQKSGTGRTYQVYDVFHKKKT